MEKPDSKETRGVPWADHNQTEDTGADTRREEYGEEAPAEVRGPGESGSSATGSPADEDRGDVEDDLQDPDNGKGAA